MGARDISPEVLTEIFRLAIGNPVSKSKTRNSIGLVTRHWREVLYGTRALWSTISIVYCDHKDDNQILVEDTDFDHLEQCLALSHPHPLDISLVLDFDWDMEDIEEHGGSKRFAAALQVISAHLMRWRSFSLSGREWAFEWLPPMYNLQWAPLLESFAIRLDHSEKKRLPQYDCGEPASTPLAALTNFDVNFPMPDLKIPWGNLVSLRMGFDDIAACHRVLTQATSLSELTLLHVGVNVKDTGADPAPVLHLPHIRRLRLTQCGLANMKHFLFERLDMLALIGDQDNDERPYKMHVSHQLNTEEHRCKTVSHSSDAEALAILHQRVKGPVLGLALDWEYVEPTAYIPLLSQFPSLASLSVVTNKYRESSTSSHRQEKWAVSKFLHAVASPSFAPNLESFEFVFNFSNYWEDADFFNTSPLLETVLTSLRMRKGSRLRRFVVARDEYADEENIDFNKTEVYMASSLYRRLFALGDQGMDTAWWVGDENLLLRARRQRRPYLQSLAS